MAARTIRLEVVDVVMATLDGTGFGSSHDQGRILGVCKRRHNLYECTEISKDSLM